MRIDTTHPTRQDDGPEMDVEYRSDGAGHADTGRTTRPGVFQRQMGACGVHSPGALCARHLSGDRAIQHAARAGPWVLCPAGWQESRFDPFAVTPPGPRALRNSWTTRPSDADSVTLTTRQKHWSIRCSTWRKWRRAMANTSGKGLYLCGVSQQGLRVILSRSGRRHRQSPAGPTNRSAKPKMAGNGATDDRRAARTSPSPR